MSGRDEWEGGVGRRSGREWERIGRREDGVGGGEGRREREDGEIGER